jgi:ADP-ribose pyrophosphatase YjhB (NUDIX family)
VLGVGALIIEGEKVLLVKRGREPLAGFWSLPGGCVETGERLEDAIQREVLEETSLHVTARGVAAVFERLMPDPAGLYEYHYVLIDFYCDVQSGTPGAGDDSSDVAWFSLEDLPGLQLTAGTLKVIQELAAYPPASLRVTRP